MTSVREDEDLKVPPKRRVRRCTARHPLHAEVRCEEPAGHSGQHAHSFYARYWEDA